MLSLESTIEKLKSKDVVDAVFLTGSEGAGRKLYSDIDLVIILKDNVEKIQSLYTWIDGKFADIFFFDLADLKRLQGAVEIPANSIDGSFVSWTEKAVICFDKSGEFTRFYSQIGSLKSRLKISPADKDLAFQKINYNLIANTRYFNSDDPAYHEALELRLAYSLAELITGYFDLRDIPWRGEKNALAYLKENDGNFYQVFREYTKADSLAHRFKSYTTLVSLVLPQGYALWREGEVSPQSKDRSSTDKVRLMSYWEKLTS